MSFVHSSAVNIYYEVHGSGPAVVFGHGAGSNAATWWQQIPAFAEHFTCIVYDNRCYGRSYPADAELFQPTRFVDDVVAILDAEGIEKAAFVGQSMGGMTGLRFALAHPARNWAFVACDSPLSISHEGMLANINAYITSKGNDRVEERALGKHFREASPEGVFLYRQINHFNPAIFRASENGVKKSGTYNRFFDPDFLLPMSALTGLSRPTMFLVGSEDPVVKPAIARELASYVHGARYVEIAHAGHSAYFERPDVFNHEVLAFLLDISQSQ